MGSAARRFCVTGVLALAIVVTQNGHVGAAAGETEIEGAADFRTAPRLSDGQFRDRVVSGESVFYSVLYRNNVPYEFTLDFIDGTDDELETATLTFIAPTLGELNSDAALVNGSAQFDAGGVNQWFLSVTLATEGQLGVEREFTLGVSGTVDGSFGSCDSTTDCDADQRLADAQNEISELEAELAGRSPDAETTVANLEAAKATAADLEAQVQEATPDDEPPVPIIGALGLVAAALLFFLLLRPAKTDAPPAIASEFPQPEAEPQVAPGEIPPPSDPPPVAQPPPGSF